MSVVVPVALLAVVYLGVKQGPRVGPRLLGRFYPYFLWFLIVAAGLAFGFASLGLLGVVGNLAREGIRGFWLYFTGPAFLLSAVSYYLAVYLARYYHFERGGMAQIGVRPVWQIVVLPPLVAIALVIIAVYLVIILALAIFAEDSEWESRVEKKRDPWRGSPPEFGGRRAAETRRTTDWLGNHALVHTDQSGNKIGESRRGHDWLGTERWEHFDTSGKRVGTSSPGTDWLGQPREEHFSGEGRKVGESRPGHDWFGMPRTEHFNRSGEKTGESRPSTDWLGMPRVEHFDEGGKKGGGSQR